MSKIDEASKLPGGVTPGSGGPETATEKVDREDAAMPHGGLSPDYDDEEISEESGGEAPGDRRVPGKT